MGNDRARKDRKDCRDGSRHHWSGATIFRLEANSCVFVNHRHLFKHPPPHQLYHAQRHKTAMPPRRTAAAPSVQSRNMARAPPSYLQAAYHELTAPENRSVVKSVVMFGVSLPLPAAVFLSLCWPCAAFPGWAGAVERRRCRAMGKGAWMDGWEHRTTGG